MKFPPFEPILLHNNTDYEPTEVPISEIFPDKEQPRKFFDETSLEELALSIKNFGIIQPIIVKKINGVFGYQIIAGERRWNAAKRAGLKKIPVIIKNYSSLEKKAIALIENIQRKDLNPLEEAEAIQELLKDYSMNHRQVAENIGKSRVSITNLLRLLNLELEVKKLLNIGSIEMGHAKALLTLSGLEQISTANEIVNRNMTVRQAENYIRRISSTKKYNDNVFAEDEVNKIKEWEEILSKRISSKVKINIRGNKKLEFNIKFNSFTKAQFIIENILLKI